MNDKDSARGLADTRYRMLSRRPTNDIGVEQIDELGLVRLESSQHFQYGMLIMVDDVNAMAEQYVRKDDLDNYYWKLHGEGGQFVYEKPYIDVCSVKLYDGPFGDVVARLGMDGWEITPVKSGHGAMFLLKRSVILWPASDFTDEEEHNGESTSNLDPR